MVISPFDDRHGPTVEGVPSPNEPILFVDDEPEIGELVRYQLRPHGYDVDVATSAKEALARTHQRAYRAVITDLHMPGGDGIALIRRLQHDHPALAVVLVSGDPILQLPDDRTMDETLISVITKPWDPTVFLASISRAVQITCHREQEWQSPPELRRVLLIEDSETDATLFQEFSQEGGLNLELTRCKRLDSASELLSENSWDIVVTDLSLPDARGLDTVLRLRQAAPSTPLVVLSGLPESEFCDDALRMGAQECLSKEELTANSLTRALRHALERKVSEDRLLKAAYEDSLTGLGNRAMFRSRLRQALARSRRSSGRLGLLFFDLDRFKEINDGWGHHAGDAVLTTVGDRLTEALRAEDTLARLGGDEFAILVEDIETAQQARRVGERVLSLVSQPCPVAGELMEVNASVGIALYPDHAEDEDELLRLADQAMYQAKAAGGGRVFVLKGTGAPRPARFVVERELRRALARSQFDLHYQPQICMGNGTIVGCEALIRWRRENGQLVPPANFIASLEETGQIVAVGEWVAARVCQDLRRWLDQGLKGMTVSFNVSPRQFEAGDLPSTIFQATEDHRVAPEMLEVEVTEALVIKDLWQSQRQLAALRRRGIGIALDDFGTGYSSLATLHRMPIDILKIDRSFVGDLESSEDSRTLADVILSLGHRLDLEVVAEGVETPEQFRVLQQAGCERSQGYLHARPMPRAEFEAVLVRNGLVHSGDV